MPEKYREYIHGDKAEIPYGETVIEEYAFLGCKDLTALEIPDSVKTIGRRAFYCCTGLTSVEIPNSVTEIGAHAFYGCTGLTSIEIPNSVIFIGESAFQGHNIERLVVHSQNPRYSCSGNCVLSKNREILVLGCKASIIPNSVKTISGFAFASCTGLTSVEIPDSVKTIGRRAFYCCTGLTSVEIPNSVTEIGAHAFYGCTGLTSIEIPNSVIFIGESAFQGHNIERLVVHSQNPRYSCSGNCVLSKNREILVLGCKASIIPNSVKTIGGDAFAGCTGLTSVEIPDSVKTIGGNAFFGCTGLTIIKFHNSKPSESQILLEALGIEDYGQISLYTPIGAGYAYRHNDFFKQFKEIIPTLR